MAAMAQKPVVLNSVPIIGTFSSKTGAMIWYLLYPFRGTTEPPSLGPNHPLRRFFTQYGRDASRHPVITLLISVAIGAILIYPFPFLYTNNFTNGSSNLPHHVWTAAQPFEGKRDTQVDVVMRSIWVHGSYMKALDTKVLLAALEIQDDLLGSTVDFKPTRSSGLNPDDTEPSLSPEMRDVFHASNGLSEKSWFFHSPLLYWSCSAENVANDPDIITTVNEGSKKATSVNVTLRHSIVFSGKRFEDHRLVAADALVITLLHKLDSPVGKQWERQAEKLSRKSAGRWRLYPRNGQVLDSELYEFKFQPLSMQDDIFLGIAYSLTFIYFILSLTRLRALKSRFGLTLAVITQSALSIMSSFTICAVFKIDLSKIPREVYPLVVLTIGLENMFRLVNAVIVTPSEFPTVTRIAEALGQTGHIALAGVGQNLFLLWLLYKVVSPGVASFCIFAGTALTLDFMFLLTFFVAVLSVDVRRTELSDSLERAEERSKQRIQSKLSNEQSEKRSWTEAVIRGEVPISTRVAGTIVMIGFVLALQWHFFDKEHPLRTLSRIVELVWKGHKTRPPSSNLLSINVNQARTPTAWLRLQDHETAREVIQVIKPNAHSYLARVYEPLVFVLDGSDRRSSEEGIRPFLPAVYDFLRHQSSIFFMTVVFIVAAISLFMNYLLWDEDDLGNDNNEDRSDDGPLLVVKTLDRGHALDVIMLTTSPEGIVVSVGLDRWIRIWDVRHGVKSYLVDRDNNGVDPFPIVAIAVDDLAQWLAILSSSGKIMLWNIPEQQWGVTSFVEVKGRTPLAFFFQPTKANASPSLVTVGSNGILREVSLAPDQATTSLELPLCKSPLVLVRQFLDKVVAPNSLPIFKLVTCSRRGCVHVASQVDGGWKSEAIEISAPPEDFEVRSIVPLPSLRLFLAVRRHAVDIIDLETSKTIHTFEKFDFEPETVRCFHSTRRKSNSGASGLAFLSLIYTDRNTNNCVIRTYIPKREGDLICICVEQCSDIVSCCSWEDVIEQTHQMENAGKWYALPSGAVVGVRKRSPSKPSLPIVIDHNGLALPTSNMTRRGNQSRSSYGNKEQEEEDVWEAWLMSAKGESMTVPLSDDHNGESPRNRHQLLVSSCGNLTRIGRRSVAVTVGNVIKVITVGRERFENKYEASEDATVAMAGLTGRRRKYVAYAKRSTVE